MIALGGNDGSLPLMVLGVILIVASLGTIALRRRKKDYTPGLQDYMREQTSLLRQEKGVKDDMRSLYVQLSELARQINAQIDTRFAKLDQAVGDADRRIAALEALLRKAAGIRKLDVLVGDDNADPADPAAGPVEGSDGAAPTGPATDPRYTRIYELADAGNSLVEISRQTGHTTGEIELILNLRKSGSR